MLAEADGDGRRAASSAPVCSNLPPAEPCNAANRFAPHGRGSSRWLRRQTASAAARGNVVPALRAALCFGDSSSRPHGTGSAAPG